MIDTNGSKKYPISEIFTNFQGEGVFTGVVMTFVRLAGCTVGKPYPKERYEKGLFAKEIFPIYTEKCTLYDGREFACDTDYRVKSRLTAEEIVSHIPSDVDRVCITGGEPCMHSLIDLLPVLSDNGKRNIHLETSGTIYFDLQPVWITVSPKKGILTSMLNRADELKFLVDENFNPEIKHYSYNNGGLNLTDSQVSEYFIPTLAKEKPVYLNPVNHEREVNADNLEQCRYWQKRYRQFRVGIQLHKAIEHYTKEREL